MEFLTALWLPIVLSAVLVFLVSWLVHVLLPIHKGDLKKVPGEEKVLSLLREQRVSPGTYMFPYADSMKEMQSAEMKTRYKEGPVGFLTLRAPGGLCMGRSLGQWFLFCLVIGIFTGYLTWIAAGENPTYLAVFRIAGTVAVLTYALSNVQDSIWKSVPWRVTAKYVVDGVIYGLLTAGCFAGFWPR